MVFAIDAGNTNIVLGAFAEDNTLRFTARVATDPAMTADQYAATISNILKLYEIDRADIEGSIISTVVPALVKTLSSAIKLLFGKSPLVVGGGVDSGLTVKGMSPDAIGADLVCGAVGAMKKYPLPLIIFDFGTATTITAIDRDGVFIGGSIIPGVMISLKALSSSAALLQDIDPDGTDVPPISLDTAMCMRSGSLLGSASMMDGMIARFRDEIGQDATVVATGGLAGVIVPYCKTADIIHDRDLLLDGLYEMYKKNA